MSGIVTREGFKNLSKRRPYRRGSISVIQERYARIAQAAEPRPGQTGIPLFFQNFIKSATIQKYQLNPIRSTTKSSYSKREIIHFSLSQNFAIITFFSSVK